VQNFFSGATTQHAVAQGFDDLATFDDGAHDVAGLRTAIESPKPQNPLKITIKF
jgi:hypothetical protein